MRVRARRPRLRRVARVAEVERREDPALQLGAERVAGRPLDDQLGDDVVRVRVRPAARRARTAACARRRFGRVAAATSSGRSLRSGRASGSAGRPRSRERPLVWLSSWRIVIVVSVRDDAGQPLLDRVVEAELALGDELEDDRRGVGLGQARDLEAVAGADRRLPATSPRPAVSRIVVRPSRTNRIAPGAPAATSASRSSAARWHASPSWRSPLRRGGGGCSGDQATGATAASVKRWRRSDAVVARDHGGSSVSVGVERSHRG